MRCDQLCVLGLRSPVIEAGPEGAEEAVLLLHGQPGSSRDWDDLLARIGESARAVAFDLPGFGSADKPDNWNYSYSSFALFVAAATAALGIRRVHLVMHDLGGAAGLLWAAAHPEQFASAAIVDTGVLVGYRRHGLARALRIRGMGEAMTRITTRRSFYASMRRFNPQPRPLPEAHVERMWNDYDLATRRASMKTYRSMPRGGIEPLRPTFRALDRPALVVWGGHDPAVPVEQAQIQLGSFPSAEVVVLEDSGHWPFLDDPEQAAAHIVPFLQRQVGRSHESEASSLS